MTKAQYEAIRAEMIERFPKCFFAKGAVKQPLQIGIHDHLIKACQGVDPMLIRQFLRRYTQGDSYLAALGSERPRIGLDGTVVNYLEPTHVAFAKHILAARIKSRQQKSPGANQGL